MENSEWYYAKAGQQHGPVSKEILVDMIKAGGLSGGAMVWRDGMDSWSPVTSVAELSGYLPDPGPDSPSSAAGGARQDVSINIGSSGSAQPGGVVTSGIGPGQISSGSSKAGKTLCVLSIVFGAIAFLLLPPFIGGAGLICGIIGVLKSEDKALGIIGIVVSVLGIIVGMIIGYAMWA